MAEKRPGWRFWKNEKKQQEQKLREERRIQDELDQLQREEERQRMKNLQRESLRKREEERQRQENLLLEELRQTQDLLDLERKNRAREAYEREEKEREDRKRQEKERIEAEFRERKLREKEREDREKEKSRLKMISTENLRELRELIRTKYELDVEIWSLRKVRKPDRDIVVEKMERADAVMMGITDIIQAWEGTEGSWSSREWEQAQEIKMRIQADGKRVWASNPPWEEN